MDVDGDLLSRDSSKQADAVQPEAGPSTAQSQAAKIACVACRSLKMACRREAPENVAIPCDRCKRMKRECVVPPYRKPGRVKGAKNKFRGLDRALYQIQSELERVAAVKGAGVGDPLSALLAGSEVKLEADTLASLLAARKSLDSHNSDPYATDDDSGAFVASTSTTQLDVPQLALPDLAHLGATPQPLDDFYVVHTPDETFNPLPRSRSFSLTHLLSPSSSGPSSQSSQSPHHTLEVRTGAISNPLGLLAEASEAVRSVSCASSSSSTLVREPPTLHARPVTEMLSGSVIDSRISSLNISWEVLAKGLLKVTGEPNSAPMRSECFFRPRGYSAKRDLNPEWDPLEIGLLTEQQSTVFFREFWTQLHPFTTVLDPLIHTPTFVRLRSFFLYTAICAAGAQFSAAATADVSKRLRFHAERLAKLVLAHDCKSLEIAQGFLIWFPWLPPSERLSEDRLFFFMQQCLAMATELGLDRPVSVNDHPEQILTALGDDLQGLDMSDPDTLQRMIRNRERFWLRFFSWESASAVSFNRSSVFIENALIRNEDWHVHRLACSGDWETCAITRLRRYVISLTADVKYRLKNSPKEGSDWIRPYIDELLDPWRVKWLSPALGENTIPPSNIYIELLYRHARLFILSSGLHNSDPEPSTEPPAIVNDCLVAALEAVHAAVQAFQSSRYYWKLPNTVFPMVTWAAVLSIKLFDCDAGVEGWIPSQASLLGLLGTLALLLEQAGTTPSHRLGVAAIYGSHLKSVVRARIHSVWSLHEATVGGRANLLVGVKPGTFTPIYGDAGCVPFQDWGTEWWSNAAGGDSAGQLPWSEEVRRMLFELDGNVSAL